MASISSDGAGNRIVQFIAADRKRRTIRLGKVTAKVAESIKARVEALNAAKVTGTSLDTDTAAWLAKVGDDLAAKLAAVGLVAPRAAALLGPFVDSYIAGRTDVKWRTTSNLGIAAKRLKVFFGEQRNMKEITPADADRFVIDMRANYADATTSRTIKRAKQFFRAAIRARLVTEDPFAGIKPGGMDNPERKHFIDRATTARVLEKCPDAEWRLLVALSRYGGLRCPSEHLALTWPDIDWRQGRFIVRSSKTGARIVPLFAELRPFLDEAFALAKTGAVHVIAGYRDDGKNFRTRLNRIIERAGLKTWPKPFHNLRASRETELAAEFPIHVVCEWIGNTELIAAKHYLQVTEGDFAKATAEKALHNPVQSAAVRADQQRPAPGDEAERERCGPSLTAADHHTDSNLYPQGDSDGSPQVGTDRDLQLLPFPGAAQSGASADLAAVIAAWPDLTPATRNKIVALCATHQERKAAS